jgi:hypothetical protein
MGAEDDCHPALVTCHDRGLWTVDFRLRTQDSGRLGSTMSKNSNPAVT